VQCVVNIWVHGRRRRQSRVRNKPVNDRGNTYYLSSVRIPAKEKPGQQQQQTDRDECGRAPTAELYVLKTRFCFVSCFIGVLRCARAKKIVVVAQCVCVYCRGEPRLKLVQMHQFFAHSPLSCPKIPLVMGRQITFGRVCLWHACAVVNLQLLSSLGRFCKALLSGRWIFRS
jgi:hypothetical protein